MADGSLERLEAYQDARGWILRRAGRGEEPKSLRTLRWEHVACAFVVFAAAADVDGEFA